MITKKVIFNFKNNYKGNKAKLLIIISIIIIKLKLLFIYLL